MRISRVRACQSRQTLAQNLAAAGVALSLMAAGCSSDYEPATPPANNAGTGSILPRTAAGSPAPIGTAGNPSIMQPTLPAAGSGGQGIGPDQQPSATGTLPCEVAKIVSEKCGACHGAAPAGGAPMPLLRATDFSAQLKSLRTVPGETKEVAALVKARINDPAMPMPPGALLPEAERAVLNQWLDGGHPHGAASDVSCLKTPSMPPRNQPPKNPDGTVCYQFRNHGVPEPGDVSPYGVVPGEHYVSFYYNAPWAEPSELVSWRTIYDNEQIMHHWLLYSTVAAEIDGTFAPSIGTHIGDAAQLIAGWAVGGNDVKMPADVGLQLPAPGAGLLLEWHFYNTTGQVQEDSSAVEVCVLPAGTQKHTAGMTWLGTEYFNGPFGMPPRVESQYSGTCLPSRTGMNATDPIKIFTLWPHMHEYGRHMRSVVHRADGTEEEVFNKPFDFNYQITYDAAIELFPGDTITSTCTFMNTSDAPVAFGPSSDQEMCYQFAFSYPVGALDNGVPSLVGATNTCW